MKNSYQKIVFLVFLTGVSVRAQAQLSLYHPTPGTSVPVTCMPGDVFVKTDAAVGTKGYLCIAANTFEQQTGAGGSPAWGGITGTLSDQTDLNTALGGKVSTATTVNSHALSGNVTVSASDVGLGSVENTALSTWVGSANITTLGTITVGTFPYGGLSGVPSTFAPSAHTVLSHSDAVSAAPVLGDMLYGNVTPAWTKLAGQITTTQMFLSQTGTGAVSAAPVWAQPACSDLSNGATGCSTTVGTAATHPATDFATAGAAVAGGTCTNGIATAVSTNGVPSCTTGDTATTHALFATAGDPAFRAIAAGDIPTLNQNTTGSAATLTTPRAINGTNFDGSQAITVTAAAGTLIGTTLNSTVVTSSLTTVGTLATPVINHPTIGIAGTASSAHVKTVGTAPTCAFSTGGGTSPSCAMETGSTDMAGTMTISTGTGSPGSSGTITLTFNATMGTNSPACVTSLTKGATDWSVNSTVRITTQSTTAPVFSWTSASATALVTLTTSTNYKISYVCFAK